MRNLTCSLAALVASLALFAPSASASSPVPWNQCRGLQHGATLLGRPPEARAHFCSARQQLEPQDLTDYYAVRRAGDAEQFLLDAAGAEFSGEFPAGELHSIGDKDTEPTGVPNPNGTNWYVEADVYSRSGLLHGTFCHFVGNVVPLGIVDDSPSWQTTITAHTCGLTY